MSFHITASFQLAEYNNRKEYMLVLKCPACGDLSMMVVRSYGGDLPERWLAGQTLWCKMCYHGADELTPLVHMIDQLEEK